jgi:phosphopantothenoylcysteine synthetase/decarboxylase
MYGILYCAALIRANVNLFVGKKAKQEQIMKCQTDIVNTKRIEDTDVSGSGSGNDDDDDDDDGDDGGDVLSDALSDADDISPTNDGVSTSPQP